MLFVKFSTSVALFVLFAVFVEPALAIKKSYVVYLGGHPHGPNATTADLRRASDSHAKLLASFLGSEEKARDAMIYSYKRYINGFSAVLEEEEAVEIAKHPDVISVFMNRGKKLHTTHSWDFLMLERNGVIQPSSIWTKARFGEDVIVANLDTGVWPESKSFSGEGYGPIPSKWKGICQLDDNAGGSLCNRKLIGARFFNKGYAEYVGKSLNYTCETPRDYDGHGTHTLSTAAGNFVPGASVFGVGNGTAKGGSPWARVAAYRICFPGVNWTECVDSDVIKAFDTAMHDGVDVFSVSLGGDPVNYFDDGVAIGSFHAVKEGRVVVASAGNSGPEASSVSNNAPWIITVGASSIDRTFHADVVLGNGTVLKGMSLSQALPEGKSYPFMSAARGGYGNVSAQQAILCKNHTLDPLKVKDKVVLCLRGDSPRVEKGIECARAGAAGMILYNDESTGDEILADVHYLPATHINYTQGLILIEYVNNTRYPKGRLTPPEAVYNFKPAPVMTSFSSRGPNAITPEILKPDVTAPGLNIIASYSEGVSPTGDPLDNRKVSFLFETGTSMSCPHVAGVAGLLKTLHPDWSPAAIRSAIMTTATTRDNTMNRIQDYSFNKAATPFAYGSGHLHPNRAMDPGLVYDLEFNDYLNFLCAIGYNRTTSMSLFAGSNYNCPADYDILSFNNPSFSIPRLNRSVSVTRKLKNVGSPGTYVAHVRNPVGYSITVEPTSLKFDKIGEEKSFKLTIESRRPSAEFEFGQLTWFDGKHHVRSPIAVASDE